MRRTTSADRDKGRGVVWDEQNLQENAVIQAAYAHLKINEPKTPYRAPLDTDEDDEMRPLALDEASEAAATSRAALTAFEYVMSNGGAEFEAPGPSQRRLVTASSSGEAGPSSGAAAEGAATGSDARCKRQEPSSSGLSSDGGACSDGSVDKRRRFEAMRKQHYNMRAALKQAKELLASEEEEDEEADTAHCHSNGVSRAAAVADVAPSSGQQCQGDGRDGMDADGPGEQQMADGEAAEPTGD